MVMGPLCALLIWLMPIEDISASAHHMLAIMSLVAIWWITEPVPIPVTSLLGPTLCVVLDIAPMKDAFDNFANPMIFLFMGGFLLAKGMMVNGLDKRMAYGIMSMKWVGDSPRKIFLAIGHRWWRESSHRFVRYDSAERQPHRFRRWYCECH